uniref:Lysosomal membrane ascorbate-dependent ferrireductase CYB561A3 n=1 Tax=Sus scrofa TaxID=9823 RepID=A0A8D1MR08_PIG
MRPVTAFSAPGIPGLGKKSPWRNRSWGSAPWRRKLATPHLWTSLPRGPRARPEVPGAYKTTERTQLQDRRQWLQVAVGLSSCVRSLSLSLLGLSGAAAPAPGGKTRVSETPASVHPTVVRGWWFLSTEGPLVPPEESAVGPRVPGAVFRIPESDQSTVRRAASLAYRLPQSWVGPKLPWKLGHAAMHLMAFILTVLGLAAVFNFHNHEKIPNLYSLHSWLGITTVFLFACQWFLGFVVFLLPWASVRLRSLLKPIHVFFGASILSLAIASVISGINEKLFFSLKNGTTSYSNLPDEAVFANSAGMLVVVFGLLVLYILQASSWKRPEPGLQAERQVWGLGFPSWVGVGPGLEKGHPVKAWALPERPPSNMVGNQVARRGG